ncbi:MAG: class I SAM-dependent methyltransferase [Candidatus Heimdallarchaeota archaeon]|nr:class I SAM-dependent methyltransferase [Candidatus Heimdallarchaeota archaeon]
MRMYEAPESLSEEVINKNLDILLKLSALKASKIFENLDIYNILNRPRSPEEIFHMSNFNTLDEEFVRIFDLLTYTELLTKQGEFYAENPRRKFLEEYMETDIKAYDADLISHFSSLFDRLASIYESILKGESSKLTEVDLINAEDSIFGSEYFFQLRSLFYKSISQRISLFFSKDKLTFLNWGNGSGYDALHLADFYRHNVKVISIEPPNTLYRCQVLQDIYEIYNVEFIEYGDFKANQYANSIDLVVGSPFLFKEDVKQFIDVSKTVLNDEGYLALPLLRKLSLSFDWIMGVYEPYNFNMENNALIAKLKHYGISKLKYIGLDESFVLMQKT